MEQLAPLLPPLRPLSACSSFEEQVRVCAQVATGKRPDADTSAAASSSSTPVESLRGLIVFFIEAARQSASAADLEAALASVLPADRAHTVATVAAEGQLTMRAALDALSLGPAELVDVHWQRATIVAAGHELPRPGGTPLYTVTLTTRAPDGSTKPLQFWADTEELTDLVRCAATAPCLHASSVFAPVCMTLARVPPDALRRELKCAMRQVERESS